MLEKKKRKNMFCDDDADFGVFKRERMVAIDNITCF
jgi:hypothetical protein